MTEFPERDLWQTVILRAFMDACHPDPKSLYDIRAKREADHWLRFAGRDFKRVCQLAGMDYEFIHDAYVSGRIDPLQLYRAAALNRINRAAAE